MSDKPRFRESLPDGCPPEDAALIEEGTVIYRVANSSNPPKHSDFDSWRMLHPSRPPPNDICECRACSVSVHIDLAAAKKLRRKYSKYRKNKIYKITLRNKAGRIKKTGGKSHYSWWPLASYDILSSYELLS